MIDLAEIERIDLKAGNARGRLDAVLAEVATYAEARSAAEIATLLQHKKEADPALSETLDPFIAKFRSLALPILTDIEAASVADRITTVIADERIGIYERLRARLLVLPQTKRASFAQKILDKLRASPEPLGAASIQHSGKTYPPTVGSWVRIFEAMDGIKDPQPFFALPDFQKLDDRQDHALRHLVHLTTLLSSPEKLEAAAIERPKIPRARPKVAVVPAAPPNLPVEPVRPVPAAPSPRTAYRGPTMAAVVARLQQSQQESIHYPSAVAHLTPEDQEEIKQHSVRLEGIGAGPNVHDTLDEAIEGIIKSARLTFPDEHLRNRFVTIVTSRIKDIRTSAETVELLTRPVKIGGMGYESGLAEQIVAEASVVASKFHDHDEVQKMISARLKAQQQPMPKPPRVPSASAVPPLREFPPPQAPPFAAAPTVRFQPRPVAATAPSQPLATASLRPLVSDRPTVADIRGTARLIGPTEELRTMTLVDFRRLGQGPIESVRRIYEKIQRLGTESFTKKAEGIRAWRDSEPYRLYVTVGQEALLSSKNMRDIIAARQGAGQSSLSEQEFILIADLNRKLRY